MLWMIIILKKVRQMQHLHVITIKLVKLYFFCNFVALCKFHDHWTETSNSFRIAYCLLKLTSPELVALQSPHAVLTTPSHHHSTHHALSSPQHSPPPPFTTALTIPSLHHITHHPISLPQHSPPLMSPQYSPPWPSPQHTPSPLVTTTLTIPSRHHSTHQFLPSPQHSPSSPVTTALTIPSRHHSTQYSKPVFELSIPVNYKVSCRLVSMTERCFTHSVLVCVAVNVPRDSVKPVAHCANERTSLSARRSK